MASPFRLGFWSTIRIAKRGPLVKSRELHCVGGLSHMDCFHPPLRLASTRLAKPRAHPAPAGPENVQYRSVFIQLPKSSGSPAAVSRGRRPTRY
jgi:hypothetical protein